MKRQNDRPEAAPSKHSKPSGWSENLKKVLSAELKHSKSVSSKPQSVPDPNSSHKQLKEELKSEADFHLQQSKKRSEIRAEQGRATVFDKLLLISRTLTGEIRINGSQTAEEMKKPFVLIEELKVDELEILKNSIEVHLKLEKSKNLKKFWDLLLIICEMKPVISSSMLKKEIEELVKGKDLAGLEKMKKEVIEKGAETGFWFEVLAVVEVERAKMELEKTCKELEQESERLSLVQSNNLLIKNLFSSKDENKVNFGDGRYSPVLMDDLNDLNESFEIFDESTDISDRESLHSSIFNHELSLLKSNQSKLSIVSSPLLSQNSKASVHPTEQPPNEEVVEAEAIRELQKSSTPDESDFSDTVQLKTILQDWMKKFKPRKPKFFNRIKTGYDWNRYNQSHYNHLSPPPKIVQGYKFNIFYPYLLDKSKAPQFYLEPEETTETCIIRFHAGPPYEDIAFRIVNREWDFSDRNGFKCFFDKGILHLYFCFKRYRYKR